MALPNTWHHRRVADTAAKACFICYKPSSSVLITPDSKDFFYICPTHLHDRNFCSPIMDTAGQEAKMKQEALGREVEKVKREYEEKQKRKKEKEKKAEDKDEKKDDSEKEKEKEKEKAKGDDEKERDEKIDSLEKQGQSQGQTQPQPQGNPDTSTRIFSLHKNFYQMRIDRQRNLEMAKRNRQRMQDPSFFPSVPSGGL